MDQSESFKQNSMSVDFPMFAQTPTQSTAKTNAELPVKYEQFDRPTHDYLLREDYVPRRSKVRFLDFLFIQIVSKL